MRDGRRWLCVAAVAASSVTVVPAASAANQWAYAWADQPTVETYSPDANHQGTSSGQPISVLREDVGRYDVQLTGIDGEGGTVDITAAANGAKVVCAGAGVTREASASS